MDTEQRLDAVVAALELLGIQGDKDSYTKSVYLHTGKYKCTLRIRPYRKDNAKYAVNCLFYNNHLTVIYNTMIYIDDDLTNEKLAAIIKSTIRI